MSRQKDSVEEISDQTLSEFYSGSINEKETYLGESLPSEAGTDSMTSRFSDSSLLSNFSIDDEDIEEEKDTPTISSSSRDIINEEDVKVEECTSTPKKNLQQEKKFNTPKAKLKVVNEKKDKEKKKKNPYTLKSLLSNMKKFMRFSESCKTEEKQKTISGLTGLKFEPKSNSLDSTPSRSKETSLMRRKSFAPKKSKGKVFPVEENQVESTSNKIEDDSSSEDSSLKAFDRMDMDEKLKSALQKEKINIGSKTEENRVEYVLKELLQKEMQRTENFYQKKKYKDCLNLYKFCYEIATKLKDQKTQRSCLKNIVSLSYKIREIRDRNLHVSTKEEFEDSMMTHIVLKEYILDSSRVELHSLIGIGSQGVVKSGILKLGIGDLPCAVKEIPLKYCSQDQIKKEIFAMTECNHPFLLQIYGYYFSGDSVFIVMERCAYSLFYLLRKKKTLPFKLRFTIIVQIVLGMRFLHEKNMVHRDLKTANILLSSTNQVKICDFGTTKKIKNIDGTFCGTIEYLAPEQIDDELLNDPKLIDIYSFGICLWEIWTGNNPFSDLKKKSAGNQFAMLTEITSKDLKPSGSEMAKTGAPPELIDLYNRCVMKNPSNRPQSFLEIEICLKKIVNKNKNNGKLGLIGKK